MKRLLSLLILWPALAFGAGSVSFLDGVSAFNPNTSTFSSINLSNGACIKWLDLGGTNLEIFCVDTNDDLLIGHATGINNIDLFTAGTTTIFGATDVQWGGSTALLIGGDSGAATRTDATTKVSKFGAAHYTNAEQPVGIAFVDASLSASILRWGGGTSDFNAPTSQKFYAAADTTTTAGTEVGEFTTSAFTTTVANDIQWGGNTLSLGADPDASTRTNGLTKNATISMDHYTTAQPDFTLMFATGGSSANVINYGGADAALNSATNHKFFTGANYTTLSGTEVLEITSSLLDLSGINLSLDSGQGIFANTSDAADNAQIFIGGGGSSSVTRGAYIELNGNEHPGNGALRLFSGDDTGNYISINPEGTEVLRLDTGTADFSGINLSIDNEQSYAAKEVGGTARVLIKMKATDIVEVGSTVNNMWVQSAGAVDIKGPSGANNIVEIQAATTRQSELRMAGDDIAHAITGVLPADVYASMSPVNATDGGALIRGITSSAGRSGLTLSGFNGNGSPTEAPILLKGYKTDGGTSVTTLAATEKVFELENFSTDLLTIYGSGAQAIVSTATTQTTLDITADSTTESFVIQASADGLTTGSILYLESNSADASTRSLSTTINNNVNATGTVVQTLRQDSTGSNLLLNTDGNATSLNIDSDATTSNTLLIDTPLSTTGTILNISSANSLTTASAIRVQSNSASTAIRNLYYGVNDNALATSARVMYLQQDSSANNLFLDTNGDATSLSVDSEATTAAAVDVDALGTGAAFNADVNGNGKGMELDKDIYDATNDAGMMQIINTSWVTDAGTYTKSGNTLAITDNVGETSGTITDTVITMYVQNTHPDATGDLVFLDADGTNQTALHIDAESDTAIHVEGGDVLFSGTGAGLVYGSMYVGAAFSVPIGAATPVEVDDGTATFDGWTASQLNGITFPTGGTEHYLTVTQAGIYEVCWSMSFEKDSGAPTATINAGVMIDSVATRWVGETERTVANNADTGAAASCAFFDLTAGTEEISLWIANDQSTNVTIENATVTVKLIGGT